MLKNVLLILAMSGCCSFLGNAQSVNGVPISKIDVEYIQIIGRFKAFSQKMQVELDFGQENNGFTSKDTKITDRKGKTVIFNSMIEALNFMHANGYDFVAATSLVRDSQSVEQYLLRKRKNAEAPE